MQEYAKHIAWRMLSIFWGVSARKTSVYIPKPFWEIAKVLKKVYEEVSLLMTYKYFGYMI